MFVRRTFKPQQQLSVEVEGFLAGPVGTGQCPVESSSIEKICCRSHGTTNFHKLLILDDQMSSFET